MDAEKQTEPTTLSLPSRILKLTFVALILGVAFATGQSIILTFQYLNTFEYTDFVLYATIVIFVLFVFLIVVAAIINLLIVPICQIYQNGRSICSTTEQRGRRLLVFILEHLLQLSPLILLSLVFVSQKAFAKYYLIYFIGLVVFIVITKVARDSLKKDLKKPESFTATDKETEMLGVFVDFITDTNIGRFYLCVVVVVFGYLSVLVKVSSPPNTYIYFSSGPEFKLVNLLASNSNVIAVHVDGKLQIISRNRLFKIETPLSTHLDTKITVQ